MKSSYYLTALSHFFNDIRGKFLKKTNSSNQLPWMKYKEIHIIKEVFQNLNPHACLEWGSGFSTLYFPQMVNNERFNWISIEHDESWANKIRNLNSNANVNIAHVSSGSEKAAGSNTYEDFKEYVEYPNDRKKFDFILIDGRARKYCIKKAHDLVSERGAVLLHDANRKEYHDFFHLYPHQELFEDVHKNRFGLWIGSKNLPIDELINLKKHRSIWDFHYKVGKLLGTR